jgi:hypothetical protein
VKATLNSQPRPSSRSTLPTIEASPAYVNERLGIPQTRLGIPLVPDVSLSPITFQQRNGHSRRTGHVARQRAMLRAAPVPFGCAVLGSAISSGFLGHAVTGCGDARSGRLWQPSKACDGGPSGYFLG